MNMRVGIIFLLSVCVASIQAQVITGKITDRNGNPVEFAVIVVQTDDSVYVNSAYTDSSGIFSLKADVTPFLLTVQHLMYETYRSRYASLTVGNIEMNEKSRMLSEVSVSGEHPLVRVSDGKMTYNMPHLLKDRMAVSAYEAILELPGVQEQRGKIELAGANGVTVVLNGKATNMGEKQLADLLKNMPKERIQETEVMYSAPPQYHVRGAVINLILKSEVSDVPKLQGQINALYDQGYYANAQGGAAVVYNAPKSTTDFMYSFGYSQERTGEDILSHHSYGGKVYDIEQYDRGYARMPVHTIRFGNDWFPDDKNKISFAYTSEIQQWRHAFTSSRGTYSDSENNKNSDKPIQMHNLVLGYTSGFGLSTGIDFTFYKNHATQYYRENKAGKEDAFNAESKQDIRRVSVYADQSHKLGKEWVLNYGAKFSFASDRSSQIYQPLQSYDWSASNSNSKSDEYVYDLYTGFSKSFSDILSVNASLTGEYYKHREIDSWSLFPMMEITYTARPDHIFQLSVSSDKVYPSYWEMQNAISYLSGYTEIQGNPNLKPSRSYSSQLNYILKNKYIFTVYANYTDRDFSQLPYQSSDRLVLIYKTLNFDYSSKFGLNVVVPFKAGSILDSRLTLNGFYDKAKSDHYHDISFDKDNIAFYGSLDNTIFISSKPNIKAELSGSYITRTIQGPMVISSMYRIDAGVKWTFCKGKAELSFRVNDLFNSWVPKELDLQYKTQDLRMHMMPDSRRVSLSFIYKFGGFKAREHKEVDRSRFGK
ncbi:MAG: outer membrane beta-barrel family protein [Bacteroidales bacterium]|nr:outer membrane beta-barrel family protein [Bacteroidales bacterium]